MKEEKGLWAGSPRSGVQTCFFTICHMTVDEWPLYMVFTVYPQVVCVVQPLTISLQALAMASLLLSSLPSLCPSIPSPAFSNFKSYGGIPFHTF